MRITVLLLIALTPAASAQTFAFMDADGPLGGLDPVYHQADGLALSGTRDELSRLPTAHSTDAGRTWRYVPGAPRLSAVARVGEVLFASTYPSSAGGPAGIARSDDDGLTWERIALADLRLLDLHAPDSLYTTASGGALLRSRDGVRWTDLGLALGYEGARLAAGPGGLVAAQRAADADGQATLYVSDDYGDTFATVEGVPAFHDLAFDGGALYGVRDQAVLENAPAHPGGLFGVDVETGDATQLAAATFAGPFQRQPDGRLTYSLDGVLSTLAGDPPALPDGAGWTTRAWLFDDAVLTASASRSRVTDANEPVGVDAAGYGHAWSDGGAYVTVGVARTPSARGLARDADGRFVVGTRDVFRFDGVWRPTHAGVPQVRRFVPLWGRPDSLVALADLDGVYRGQRFPEVVLVGAGAVPLANAAPALAPLLQEGAVYGLGFDGDRAFVSVRPAVPPGALVTVDRDGTERARVTTTDFVGPVFVDAGGGVWAGAEFHGYQVGIEVLVRHSADGGLTWQDRSAGFAGDGVRAFAESGGQVYAGGSGGVYRWDGAGWVHELVVFEASTFVQLGGALYAGGWSGVHRRTDGGSWEAASAGLDGTVVHALVAGTDADGPWLVAATSSGMSTTRAGLLVGGEGPPRRRSGALQVAPNPARGLVTIEATAGARVEVYDALGRLVATLPADGDTLRWDTWGVPPGVYVIRALSGDSVQTARVVVVR